MPYKDAETRRPARRASYQRRKDQILAQEKGYRKTRPEGFRRTQYKRRYGITVEQFDEMVAQQGGCCALCREYLNLAELGTRKRIHVDHCHKTKAVRGILCARCNLGLGLFKDSTDLLQAALRYLIAAPSIS